MTRTILVAGGASGVGLEIGRAILGAGEHLILTAPEAGEAARVAASLGDRATGIALDLKAPELIAEQLAGISRLDGVIVTLVAEQANPFPGPSINHAIRTVTSRLVGPAAVLSALIDRIEPGVSSGIVLVGPAADGSPLESAVDAGIDGLVASLAGQFAPVRVSGLHLGRLEAAEDAHPSIADAVKAVGALMGNRGITGAALRLDLQGHALR
jgi:NAD(P)-dependent dehydrogenase (short-subunit alcohol dehydrogenase family)